MTDQPTAPTPPAPPAPPAAPPAPPAVEAAEEPTVAEAPKPAKKKVTKKKVAAKKAEEAVAERSPEMAGVRVTTPFRLHLPSQNITILPDEEPKVELDRFVKHQIAAGILEIAD